MHWLYQPLVYEQDIFIAGVRVGDVDLTGLGKDQALKALRERFEPCLDQPLVIVDNGFRFYCLPREWGFTFDYETMLTEAFALGHEGNILRQWAERRRIKQNPVVCRAKVITTKCC